MTLLGCALSLGLMANAFKIEVTVNRREASQSHHSLPTLGPPLYLAPITIGNQTFNMQMDTGSKDSWVWGVNATDSIRAMMDKLYNPTQPSAKALGERFSLVYGSGTVEGFRFNDSMTATGLTAPSVTFGVGINGTIGYPGMHGLLGLGFDLAGQNSWFTSIKDSLPSPYFAADLPRDGPGVYTFGELPEGYSESDIHWVSKGTQSWIVQVKGWSLGGNMSMNTTAPYVAFVDTGASALYLPAETADLIYSNIFNSFKHPQAGWIIPCNTTLVADLNLQLDGFVATIPGKHLAGNDVGGGGKFIFLVQISTHTG
jgi:aspergillopepsin I